MGLKVPWLVWLSGLSASLKTKMGLKGCIIVAFQVSKWFWDHLVHHPHFKCEKKWGSERFKITSSLPYLMPGPIWALLEMLVCFLWFLTFILMILVDNYSPQNFLFSYSYRKTFLWFHLHFNTTKPTQRHFKNWFKTSLILFIFCFFLIIFHWLCYYGWPNFPSFPSSIQNPHYLR